MDFPAPQKLKHLSIRRRERRLRRGKERKQKGKYGRQKSSQNRGRRVGNNTLITFPTTAKLFYPKVRTILHILGTLSLAHLKLPNSAVSPKPMKISNLLDASQKITSKLTALV